MPLPAFLPMLAPLIKPMLIGAGTGALGGLLTGRDPLKGALVGAATGGLLGAATPAIGAGGVGATGAKLSSIDPTAGVGAFTDGASAIGSTALDPMTGQMLASQVPSSGVGAFTAQPTMFDSLTDTLSPYFNPRDMGNVALQGISNQPRQQMPVAPAGGISRGQAPQGTDVMALLQTIRQPERRRISLV